MSKPKRFRLRTVEAECWTYTWNYWVEKEYKLPNEFRYLLVRREVPAFTQHLLYTRSHRRHHAFNGITPVVTRVRMKVPADLDAWISGVLDKEADRLALEAYEEPYHSLDEDEKESVREYVEDILHYTGIRLGSSY